jgi:hypothetical protein
LTDEGTQILGNFIERVKNAQWIISSARK